MHTHGRPKAQSHHQYWVLTYFLCWLTLLFFVRFSCSTVCQELWRLGPWNLGQPHTWKSKAQSLHQYWVLIYILQFPYFAIFCRVLSPAKGGGIVFCPCPSVHGPSFHPSGTITIQPLDGISWNLNICKPLIHIKFCQTGFCSAWSIALELFPNP